MAVAVVAYTLVFAIVGQSNHWFDTRYAMREFVNNELPADAKVAVSGYVPARKPTTDPLLYGH